MKNKKKNQSKKVAEKSVKTIEKVVEKEIFTSKTDPNGSYTGVAIPPTENVVQDADDL